MLTKFDGEALTALVKGASVSKIFSFNVPQNWVAENCRLVAFVHKGGSEKDVLQVNDISLK